MPKRQGHKHIEKQVFFKGTRIDILGNSNLLRHASQALAWDQLESTKTKTASKDKFCLLLGWDGTACATRVSRIRCASLKSVRLRCDDAKWSEVVMQIYRTTFCDVWVSKGQYEMTHAKAFAVSLAAVRHRPGAGAGAGGVGESESQRVGEQESGRVGQYRRVGE